MRATEVRCDQCGVVGYEDDRAWIRYQFGKKVKFDYCSVLCHRAARFSNSQFSLLDEIPPVAIIISDDVTELVYHTAA